MTFREPLRLSLALILLGAAQARAGGPGGGGGSVLKSVAEMCKDPAMASMPECGGGGSTGQQSAVVNPSSASDPSAKIRTLKPMLSGKGTVTALMKTSLFADEAPGGVAGFLRGSEGRNERAEWEKTIAPDLPCDNDKSKNCFYSIPRLEEIAVSIGKNEHMKDIAGLASQVLPHPLKGDKVDGPDLIDLFEYLGHEQRVAKFLGDKVPNWESVKNDPQALGSALRTLPDEAQQEIRGKLSDLKTQMNEKLTSPGSDNLPNPFHMEIMGKDKFAETVMKGLDMGPSMPTWGGVDQNNPSAWNYDAQNALQAGNAAAAAAAAQKALAIDPQNAQALSTLAAADYDLKDMSAAAQNANKALQFDPNDAQAQAVARLAHDLTGAGVSIPGAARQQAASDQGGVSAASFGGAPPWRPLKLTSQQEVAAQSAARLAERKLNAGDFAAAKDAADRAIAADPHSAYAYGLKAIAELKQGDTQGGLRDAVAGLALNPSDKMAQKARAQALLKLGRYKEGLLAAEAAVSGDPRSAIAHYLLAEAKAANGDRAGSLEALRRAAALDARYNDLYKASLQVAENGDMAFLFPDLKPGALAAAASAAAPESGRNRRFLTVAGGAAAGGGLLAWLLWQMFGASLAPALKTVFTRAGRPSTGQGASDGPAFEPPQREEGLIRGQYRTLRQIGMGGMGMVYEGNDVSLDRRVAIKKMRDELRLDRRSRERFVTEAKLVAALHHPNVVDIYSIVDERDELYLIFEYVKGSTLHELIHTRGPLPFNEALRAYRGVADALEYAHGRGIIHRDLKPSNIMLNQDGQPKVMDFGIARAAKDALTRYSMTNTVVGTPPYMAPEQEQGLVRKESDVYALAVCFYETVSGKLPFAGSGGGMIMNKVNKAFIPISKVVAGLPEGIDEVFDKAFEPDPDKRYRSVTELRLALEKLAVSAAA